MNSNESVRNQEQEAEQFAFRRLFGALQKRFDSALDIHRRNPDYRMFVVMTPMSEGEPAFARIRLTSLSNAEYVLAPTEETKDDFFDVGLPLEIPSIENPELAHLGSDGYFIHYNGFSSDEGAVINAQNFRSELPESFIALMNDDVVAIPLRQRPLTA